MQLNKLNINELEDEVFLNKNVVKALQVSGKIVLIRIADLLNPEESYWDSEIFGNMDTAMEHIYDVHSLLSIGIEDEHINTSTINNKYSVLEYTNYIAHLFTHDDGIEIKVYPIKNGIYSVDLSRHIRVFALTYKLEE